MGSIKIRLVCNILMILQQNTQECKLYQEINMIANSISTTQI